MQVFNSISMKKVLHKHFDFHLYCFELSSKSKLAASLRGSFSSKNTLPLIHLIIVMYSNSILIYSMHQYTRIWKSH